ncbi:MAG: hypothetical protein ABIP13_01550 [Tepidiformaceae bacterium]
MTARYCGKCGQASSPEEAFCTACGRALRPLAVLDGAVAEGAPAAGSGFRDHEIALRHALGLLARREVSTAVSVLERLCQERPDWAVARAYLGIAYLRATRIAESRAELEEAVRLAPDSFICRSKLGEFLARLGFYDQALRELDIALALPTPDSESFHAAMELRQFSKDKAKGIFYRPTGYPQLGRFSPARLFRRVQPALPERGN